MTFIKGYIALFFTNPETLPPSAVSNFFATLFKTKSYKLQHHNFDFYFWNIGFYGINIKD